MIYSTSIQGLHAGDDDSAPLLRELFRYAAGDTVTLAPGVYNLGSSVTLAAGTRLLAAGAVLRASPALDPYDYLLGNVNAGGPIGTYPDADIIVEGLELDGADLPRNNALLWLIQTQDCMLVDVIVHHSRYMGIGIANGSNNTILRGDLHHCGNPAPTVEGGAAIWIGCTSANRTLNTSVIGTTVHECNWSAVYNAGSADCPTIGTKLIGMNTDDTGESAVFSNLWATDLEVRGCNIGRTRMVTCAASNLEIGGPRSLITGNVLAGAGNGAIDMMDTQGAEIRYNTILNPTGNGISVLARPDYPTAANLHIWRNTFATDGPSNAVAIGFYGQDGAKLFTGIKINRNNTVGGKWRLPCYIEEKLWGEGCAMWDNVGLADKS